jgi:RNA polymerase sigma-70 factor (ECF subfamily)
LIAFLLRRGPRDPEVEDCTNEAFRRTLEGYERVGAGQPLRPWVLGIARHVALDALRERRRAAQLVVVTAAAPFDFLVDQLVATDPTAEERLAVAERAHVLAQTLEAFPAEQRQALLLFHIEGLSYGEIAKQLGVPLGTVGTWLARSRQALAAALREENV